MDKHDSDALHTAFEMVLRSHPALPLPSVTDAAIAGGRRIRRRRTALAAVSALTVVSTVVVAVALTGTDAERTTPPLAPIGTTGPAAPATPHPTAPAPKDSDAASPFQPTAGATPHQSQNDPHGTVSVSGGRGAAARRVGTP
ncbi:hypothetical protein [Streptomyces griseorubiginosus]|uniref:Uncharacterized protein n=1 Tax=Streptomyces griseorubiginosus TaxID=67304 RepID=A0A101RPL3_9ACTN|nr:hypothetical protein [Streptomyces griseorubiginosus]KUN59495.1 hypothetical protein AQJ54_39275 [Streptomyces griseorubiginosus]